jgi:ParB family transcriptional regulator, chromosome partitioning protein
MSDTTTEPITLQAYDPGDLVMDANARTNAQATVTKADVALCTTIAASRADGCGNNVPITIVRRPDGRLRVRAGHRRTIGCLRAGVPVLGFVAGAEGDERADRRARLIEQWNENHHRVPMTVRDDTAVLLALFDEEMTEAAIAKATGLARPQVAASLSVARSQVATSAAERWDFLTLDQAATLAEFEDDQEALTALVQAAKGSPSQFDHVAAQLRSTRAEREARAAFTAELEAQSIAVYGERPYVPWTLALENLRDGDGNPISPQQHATCPGRAVTITYEWDWAPGAEAAYRAAHHLAADDLAGIEFGTEEEARQAGFVPGWQIGRHLCTDPREYGHTNVHGTPGQTPTHDQQAAEDQAAEAARQTEQRRRVRQRNTQWRAATDTRTSHLKAILGRKAPPAGALKLVVEAMARGETQPQASSFGHQTACELLGLAGNGAATGHRDLLLAELARASDKRAQVIALAMVLGAAEHGARDVHVWQAAEDNYRLHHGIPLAARYLAWLAGHTGYSLSDIEAEVAAHATARTDGAGQTQASTETS